MREARRRPSEPRPAWWRAVGERPWGAAGGAGGSRATQERIAPQAPAGAGRRTQEQATRQSAAALAEARNRRSEARAEASAEL